MNWREVCVNADKTAVEAVSDIMVECGSGGVSIEDPAVIRECIMANSWDAYEFPDELLNRDFVRIKAYLPCDRFLEGRISRLKGRLVEIDTKFLPGTIKDISFADIREEDWANSWKAYYKPVRVGSKIVIKPTWEDFSPEPGDMIIELDPGMAFGTGTHPTTLMCLKYLEELIKGGENVFDIGTGSGILAVAAAKLGAGSVTAVDMDEVAVKAARLNAEINGVSGNINVISGNLLDRVTGQADIVVANIVADVIIGLCPDAVKALKPGGLFLASGIIAARAEDVAARFTECGLAVREQSRMGDWVAIVSSREV